MAFPVIPDEYLDEFQKQQEKVPLKEQVVVAATKTTGGLTKLADFLIVLTVAFWYYFFTGLAIVLKRKIPAPWLRLGTRLGMAKVSSRIKNATQNALHEVAGTKNTENQPQRRFKVVDIDTKRPLRRLSVNKKVSTTTPVASPPKTS